MYASTATSPVVLGASALFQYVAFDDLFYHIPQVGSGGVDLHVGSLPVAHAKLNTVRDLDGIEFGDASLLGAGRRLLVGILGVAPGASQQR